MCIASWTREKVKTFTVFHVLYFVLMGTVKVTSVTLCIYFFKVFLDEYSTYPTVLKMEMDMGEQLTFPAVTICNQDRVNLSKVMECKNKYEDGDPIYYACRNLGTECILPAYAPSAFFNTPKKTALSLFTTCSKDVSVDELPTEEENIFKRETGYISLPKSVRESLHFHAEDIIIGCSYDEVQCSFRNFTTFWNSMFGNCFTFNSHWEKKTEDLPVKEIGSEHGLEIRAYMPVQDISTSILGTFGYKVVIHSPDIIPNVENDGLDITPGTTTHIALEQIIFHRLPEPYSDSCGKNHASLNAYYDRELCLQVCAQLLSNKTCGCGDPTALLPHGVPPCIIGNTSIVCCLERVRNILISGEHDCECPLSCFERNYETTISSSHLSLGDTLTTFQYDYDYTHLKVFFQRKETLIYSSTPKYQPQDIMNAIGGQIGLWLGISIVSFSDTFIQLMKYIYDFEWYGKRVCFNHGTTPT
ncbi:epithelial sodium channel subunit gamma-like [Tachypleus tridentatus]|uniref:epithelial sodium channel subunit gamma-like n=1 Tax=Tachypleus tridentatus TaxID=6853 RepID=UPI003FD314DC